MKKRLEWARLAAAAAVVIAALGGTASAVRAQGADRADGVQMAMRNAPAANMIGGVNTTTPIGYARFCAANPADCAGGNGRAGKVALNEANFAQLKQINDEVNSSIKPLTDIEHYGEVERWTYPEDGYGDCEDYVLLKRRRLIEAGWPAETLLITVVRDQQGEGHSVLTVITDRGDLVLDNQESAIKLWHETGYRFVKRQAQGFPNRWISLGDVLAPLTVGQN